MIFKSDNPEEVCINLPSENKFGKMFQRIVFSLISAFTRISQLLNITNGILTPFCHHLMEYMPSHYLLRRSTRQLCFCTYSLLHKYRTRKYYVSKLIIIIGAHLIYFNSITFLSAVSSKRKKTEPYMQILKVIRPKNKGENEGIVYSICCSLSTSQTSNKFRGCLWFHFFSEYVLQ